MFERILEVDITRYERQLRESRDERHRRKLVLLIEATKTRLSAKRSGSSRAWG